MSCPSVDELLGGGAAEHARSCDDCRAVLELVAARAPDGCGLAEALMAAQAAGPIAADSERLLRLHLDVCAACALVAGSLDAPAMAEVFASAAEIERSFGGERAERSVESERAAERSVESQRAAGRSVESQRAERSVGHERAAERSVESQHAAGRLERRRRQAAVLGVIALLALAVIAALATLAALG